MDKIFFRDTESPLFSLTVIIVSNVLILLKSLIYISLTRYYSILSLSWTIVRLILFRASHVKVVRSACFVGYHQKRIVSLLNPYDVAQGFSTKFLGFQLKLSREAIIIVCLLFSDTNLSLATSRSISEIVQSVISCYVHFFSNIFSNSFFVFCALIITCIDGVISTPNKFCTPAFMQSLATFDKKFLARTS